MSVVIEESWKNALRAEFTEPYWVKLTSFVKQEYSATTVYPPPKLVFNAFNLCPFDAVKVVILGQDPYHGAGQAHGLSFSVPTGVKVPPSLQNIYKEIKSDLGIETNPDGSLERWARQGVLLLNASLTVRRGAPGSHQGKGWEQFTDAAIRALSSEREHVVFLLWGNFARAKKALIDDTKHCILEAPHPSPYSAASGFFGSKHFSATNKYLVELGIGPIDWS